MEIQYWYLIIGIVCGFILAILFTKDQGTDAEINDEHKYSVLLPNNVLKKIKIEEPLDIGHSITLDDIDYRVVTIKHTENGHTIYVLNHNHIL